MDNLSEEEKKAIENISELFKRKDKIVREAQINNCMSSFKLELEQEVKDWNTVLNLIKKQSKKIEEKEAEVQRLQDYQKN